MPKAHSTSTPILLNPAVPASILFSGYVFYVSFLHITGLTGIKYLTASYFSFLYLWTAFAIYYRNSITIKLNFLDLLMIFFISFMGISLFFAKETELSQYFLPFVVLPFIIGRLLSAVNIKDFLVSIGVLGIIALLLVIFHTEEIIEYWKFRTTRPQLFGSPANTFLLGLIIGNLALIQILFLLSASFKKIYDNYPKLIITMLLATPVLHYYLIILGNKTAIISLLIFSFISFVLAKHTSLKHRLSVFALLTISFCSTTYLAPKNVQTFYSYQNVNEFISALRGKYSDFADLTSVDSRNTESLVSENNSLAVRAILWHKGKEAMSENWLFGIGFGQTIHQNIKPHSTIIQSFFEFGILGGGAFLIFYGTSLFSFLRTAVAGHNNQTLFWFAAPISTYYVLFDQIQGNLYGSAPTFLLAGIITSLYGAYIMNAQQF